MSDDAEKHPLIGDAIRIVGSQQKLAEMIGRSQSAVSRMHLRQVEVDAEAARDIDRATSGEVPRWRLRPDLWEPPVPVAVPSEARP